MLAGISGRILEAAETLMMLVGRSSLSACGACPRTNDPLKKQGRDQSHRREGGDHTKDVLMAQCAR